MSFEYERDDARQRVFIRLVGPFAVADVLAVVDRHQAELVWGYSMVYDLTRCVGLPTGLEVQRAADYMQRHVGSRPRGPIAVVASMPLMLDMVSRYRTLNGGTLYIEAFDTLAAAARWLDERQPAKSPRP